MLSVSDEGFFETRVVRIILDIYQVEQELPTLPEHLRSIPVFSGVRVTRSLVFYAGSSR
jgi:hypothetical protein